MMNFFYKTFLIAFLSGSLSIVNLPVYAADAATSGLTTTSASSTSSSTNTVSTPPVGDPTMSLGADGVMTKTDTYDFSSTKTKDNLISTITMLAIGVIGTSLLMYKKWSLDMKIAAVGCLAYVAGEIASIVNLKNEMNALNLQVVKKNDGVADQKQIDSFVQLKASYQKAKKTAKAKWMLQMGAAAVFAGALGTAIYLKLTEDTALVACQSGITTAEGLLATCTETQGAAAVAGDPEAGIEAKACTECSVRLGKLSAGLTSAKFTSETVGPSTAKEAENAPKDAANMTGATTPCTGGIAAGIQSANVTPVCAAYENTKTANKGHTPAPATTSSDVISTRYNPSTGNSPDFNPEMTSIGPSSGNGNIPFTSIEKMLFANAPILQNMSIEAKQTDDQHNVLEKMLNIVLPKAEAGTMSMLGLGAGAAATFIAIKLGMSNIMDGMIYAPIGRAVIWGMLGTAAYMASKATQAEMKIIDENIAKIDTILNDLNNLQKGVQAGVVQNTVAINPQSPVSLTTTPVTNPTTTTTNPNNNTMNCLTTNCTPVSDNLKNVNGFSSLPLGLQNVATQAASLGDSLSGSGQLSSGTLGNANGLGNKLNSIKKLTDSLANKLNNALVKAGQPKVNLDSKGKALMDQLNSTAAKILQANNMSPSSFLGGAGLNAGNGYGSGSGGGNGKGSGNDSSSTDAQAKGASGFSGSSFAPKAGKEFDFKLSDKGNGLDGLGADAAKKDGKEEKYDIGTNDINTNKGDSIFQVISDRYIRSAYPQLLEEIPASKDISAAPRAPASKNIPAGKK